MKRYSECTNEELVNIITETGDEAAYDQLFRNLAPITLHEAEMYRGRMDTYSTEDFLQEGNIVAWKILSRGNFKGGKFSTYFGAAVRKHLIRIWRDYNLKNLICIGEQQKRWYEKKKASQPPKEKKPPMTREERSRKVMAYQKEYYVAHPDKLAERREKNRIKERERRARKKAEKLAVQAEADA